MGVSPSLSFSSLPMIPGLPGLPSGYSLGSLEVPHNFAASCCAQFFPGADLLCCFFLIVFGYFMAWVILCGQSSRRHLDILSDLSHRLVQYSRQLAARKPFQVLTYSSALQVSTWTLSQQVSDNCSACKFLHVFGSRWPPRATGKEVLMLHLQDGHIFFYLSGLSGSSVFISCHLLGLLCRIFGFWG